MKDRSEQMQLLISEWEASGLNKKEFCRQRNLRYPTFHYWCKRLKSIPATGFAEVRIQRPEPIGGCEVTNNERPHSALGYRTPAQFLLKYGKRHHPQKANAEFTTFQQNDGYDWKTLITNVTN